MSLVENVFVQDSNVQKVIKEMNVIYRCRWPDLSLFDVGEDVGNTKIVWHETFSHNIENDRDFRFLEYKTEEGIRLQLNGDLLENSLAVGRCATHDVVIRQFAESQQPHKIIGMSHKFASKFQCFYCSDPPEYAYVPLDMPKNSKIATGLGEVQFFALQQRPDVLTRCCVRVTDDNVVAELIIRLTLMEETIFTVNVRGAERNIIEFEWREDSIRAAVPATEQRHMQLIISNVSGGKKTLSFLMTGAHVREIVPHSFQHLGGPSYQFRVPIEQEFGAENERNASLRLNTGMSSANTLITDEQKSMF